MRMLGLRRRFTWQPLHWTTYWSSVTCGLSALWRGLSAMDKGPARQKTCAYSASLIAEILCRIVQGTIWSSGMVGGKLCARLSGWRGEVYRRVLY
jgi:hypothetical protein